MGASKPPADAFARGAAAWPDLGVPEAEWLVFVEPRLSGEINAWEDLYLACACARGSTRALKLFDEKLMPVARAAVARIDTSGAFADDVCQKLREKLFMGERPKIGDYSGRGSLASWLRTVALRVALDSRQVSEASGDDELTELPAGADLELDLIKARYRAEFKAAFQAAFGKLSSRERNVLRLNFLDGLNIDQIGAMYGAHRATAARWIASAREQLDSGTRSALCQKLGISAEELESIVGLVESQLEVSLPRLLRKPE